jgi:hypothetical protein
MLETILSRCVKWRVPPPPVETTAALVGRHLAAAGRPALAAPAMDELLRRAALAPGIALRLAGVWGEDEPPPPDFSPLLEARSPAAIVHAAEQLGRQAGRDVAALLAAWEMSLNRSYRQRLTASPATGLDVATLASRRDLLRRARRLVAGGQVPLSGQLALEALGLAGT